MVGSRLRKMFEKPINKLGFLIAKTGISPNVFSSISIIWAIIAAYFIANKDMALGLIFVILAAVWDALDGGLARAGKKITKFGNYLDAMLDRYVEIIIYLGFAIAGFYIESLLVISGSILVSYAKARAAVVTEIDNHGWPTIGERPDRIVLLVIAMVISIFSPTIGRFGFSIQSMSLFLYIIAGIVYLGSVHRVIYAKNLLKK